MAWVRDRFYSFHDAHFLITSSSDLRVTNLTRDKNVSLDRGVIDSKYLMHLSYSIYLVRLTVGTFGSDYLTLLLGDTTEEETKFQG